MKRKTKRVVTKRKVAKKKKRSMTVKDDVQAYNEKLRKKNAKAASSLRTKNQVHGKVTRVAKDGPIARKYAAFASADKRPTPPQYKPSKLPIVLRKGLDRKKAMYLLAEVIKESGGTPPTLDLTMKDPGPPFVVAMYRAISELSPKLLAKFVLETTGKKYKSVADMLGEAKRAFHQLFLDEAPDTRVILRYDSPWKMWPHVRRKERKMADGSKMATKKKKVPNKKAAKKTAKKVAKKKVSNKKVAKKTAKKRTTGKSRLKLTDNSVIKPVKDSGTPVMPSRQKVKRAVPAKGIKFGDLKEKIGVTDRTIEAMVKKGFLEVKG